MKLLNVGRGNMVSKDRIVAIASPDSAPMKRLIQDMRDSVNLIDCTGGKKTRSVVVTDSNHIILSAMALETLSARAQGQNTSGEESTEND